MPDRRGPIRKSRFNVTIADIQVPGWQSVELPSITTQEATYRNGNEPEQARRLWGRTEYGDLTMERGVEPASAGNAQIPGPGAPAGTKLFDWYKKVRDGKVSDARKKVTVTVYSEAGLQGQPLAKWVFEKAWPKEYQPPSLDATASGDVATESITLAYYKFDRTAP